MTGLLALAGARPGGWRLSIVAAAMSTFIAVTGNWEKAMISTYLIGVSVVAASMIGMPIGIWAAGNDRVHRAAQVVIDTLQTLPAFVYLIPVVMLFRVGEFSAMIAVVAYSLVPIIRYTDHGIRQVPQSIIEAATAAGCNRRQTLWKVQLPLALPEIMLGGEPDDHAGAQHVGHHCIGRYAGSRPGSLHRTKKGRYRSRARGPALAFWPFPVCRNYIAVAREGNSRKKDTLSHFIEINDDLEKTVGEIKLVFAHNDLLAANFIDDGKRLWLFDWDYAGYNAALFDLANLASNNQFSPKQEDRLLETYHQKPVTNMLRRRLAAMKCVSLLRETLWSIVSEIHSILDFDYESYTEENLSRFDRAFDVFQSMS